MHAENGSKCDVTMQKLMQCLTQKKMVQLIDNCTFGKCESMHASLSVEITKNVLINQN